MLAIEVKDLIKEYKTGIRALDKLNIKVKKGEIFSLLGPNGAGKSSLINILTTYYNKTSGTVNILGKDLYENAHLVRSEIACVSQRISIDAHLSLMENMSFQSKMYKVNNVIGKKRIENLIESFNLKDYLNYPVGSYSGGIKRRLDIAMNMVSNPKILFLDEPTVGMDIESRESMWKTILKIKNEFNTTVFLTTHYLEEADKLSDTICIMKDGKELVSETPERLKEYIKQNLIRISFSDNKLLEYCKNNLLQKEYIKSIYTKDNNIFLNVKDKETDFIKINLWLLNEKIKFNAIEIVKPDLENVFIELTKSRGGV